VLETAVAAEIESRRKASDSEAQGEGEATKPEFSPVLPDPKLVRNEAKCVVS
jgi:hypothetical protein